MKKTKSITILIVLFISISAIWLMSEKSTSYTEPQEAITAIEKELLLIPSYNVNGKALFFFIKDNSNLGATFVREGLFGWKSEMLTWSPINFENSFENFNGYKGHGENLIYGLIRNGNDRLIKIGENNAITLDLETILGSSVVEKYQLEGLYIWYFESEIPLDGGVINLINKTTGKEIDSMDLQ